jgi:molybdopterin/thiamine biosynthesis adenylyltransferase/rhodanese-related sulfurtransferase
MLSPAKGRIIVHSALSSIEFEQYNRHLKLPGFGLQGQLSLKAAKILLVGAGGLGCPLGLYLAAAGVGTIGVVDFDVVERSNLQRQIGHTLDRVGQLKVNSLISAMKNINPLVNYHPHAYCVSEDNVQQTISDYGLVVDGSDNFSTRFLLADACYLAGVPLLHGSVHQYDAQVSLFVPEEGACYRCVFREPPRQNALAPCSEVGVLGVMPGTIGLIMATEAIKYLSGMPTPARGQILLYNALQQSLRHLPLEADEGCPLCGPNATIRESKEFKVVCVPSLGEAHWALNSNEAIAFVAQGALLLDIREWFEFEADHLSQAINLPLDQLATKARAYIPDANTSILAYCQKGHRSMQAVRQLRTLGYANSYSLSGGIDAWPGLVGVSYQHNTGDLIS